jgi:hypothetical protein
MGDDQNEHGTEEQDDERPKPPAPEEGDDEGKDPEVVWTYEKRRELDEHDRHPERKGPDDPAEAEPGVVWPYKPGERDEPEAD